ncbi:MAG TPA: DUF2203 domain-containing protein [Pirellulales bacterium]|jgi:hypothetical protein|nr:DUF2203 domain-containing protein [Pirellulales bacterium]
MSDDRAEPRKLFTVAQVNAMLPLVRAIVADLIALTREVIERRERLAHLFHDRDVDDPDAAPDDPYRAELVQVEQQMQRDGLRLRELVDELRQLGAEPKDGLTGLVDFPTMMEGRTVCLCWKLDEPEVLFWHEWDAGFAGRQPLLQAQKISV